MFVYTIIPTLMSMAGWTILTNYKLYLPMLI